MFSSEKAQFFHFRLITQCTYRLKYSITYPKDVTPTPSYNSLPLSRGSVSS